MPAEVVQSFFAYGMLCNVVTMMGLDRDAEPWSETLLRVGDVFFFATVMSNHSLLPKEGAMPGHRTIWTFAITSLALFMATLDNLVVTTALPVIRTDLGASIEGLEWTVNAYTLTFAVLLLTGAALGDRLGRRCMFVVGLAIFTGASAAAALAPSIDALVAARAVQGVGGAILTPLTLTILSARPSPPGGAGSRSARGAGSAASPSRSARSSAARSSAGSPGSGSSGSTCRSGSC